MSLQCTCPECKNRVDLSPYGEMKEHIVIECDVCGITLEVMKLDREAGIIETEIVDEGK